MRIQTVRFKNLNSLSGEWLIDFTDPHFTSSGIFAIVGATGAGKTTILDAISLALYGRTPRLKQISKSNNELMSRQTGDCFAEVEFTSTKGHFRVHWSQHRARKNPAADLQPQKHEFVAADTGKVIASKLKDVAEEVIDTTGMTFDQFTRSMLLAQGDFSKFLQANSDQRAPILEQITGTEIYSRISKQVHNCKVEEEKKLDFLEKELENLRIPSKEEVLKIQAEQQQLFKNTTRLQSTIKTTNTGLHWYQNLEKLELKRKELGQKDAKLTIQWIDSAADRARHERATKSHSLQGPYTHLNHLRQDQREDSEQLSSTHHKIKQIDTILTSSRQQSADAEKQYKEKHQELQATAATIIIVRQLDYEIEKSSIELSNTKKTLAALTIELAGNHKELQNFEAKIAESNTTLDRIKNYQKDNLSDESLLENFSGIEGKVTQLNQLSAACKQQQLQLQTLTQKSTEQKASETSKTVSVTAIIDQEKSFTKQIEAVGKEINNLAPNGLASLYSELQFHRDTANQLKVVQKLIEEQKQLRIKQQVEIEKQKTLSENATQFKKEIEQNKNLAQLQKNNVTKQEELVLLANKIESFEQEREKLTDNSPCPLCGSTSHPYRSTKEQTPTTVQKNLDIEKQKLSEFEHTGRNLELEFNRQEITLTTSKIALIEVTEKLASLEQAVQQSNFPTDSADKIVQNITRINEKIRTCELRIQKTEQYNKNLVDLTQSQKQLAQQLQSHKEDLQQIQQLRSRLDAETEVLTKTLELAKKEITTTTKTVSELISPYIKNPLLSKNELPSILGQLREKMMLWKKAITSRQEQDLLVQGFISAKDKAVQRRDLQTLEQDKLLQHFTSVTAEHKTMLTKRNDLFGTKDPLQVEKLLHTQLSESEKKLKVLQENLQSAEKQNSALQERKSQLSLTIAKRTAILTTEEEKFSLLMKENNFPTEDTFLHAQLEDKKREQLHIQLDQLETKCKETTAQLKNLEETIQEELVKPPTSSPLELLKTQLEEQTAELGKVQQLLGALTEQLKNYETNIQNQKDKQDLLARQKSEHSHWAQLHSLIGSADGKKFRNFAQGLTFELMVIQANKTLEKMSDRYLLRRTPDAPLELTVIDAYQAGEIRSTANLSGGETFIISLALALGLSAMASRKVQIDSLFLDEGFGTLDEESLEVALDTLSTLQQHGKIIGIISHVPLLKERIDVQLRLHPGLDGRSTLSGPGVSFST